MQQKFFDLLKEENKKGATILFSSHILSEVQRLCDRVAIIKDGEIVQVEKISSLKENNHKKIKIEVNDAIASTYFDLPGVTNLVKEGNQISFLFSGDINLVTDKIAGLKITNLWIEEPDLEEIFMHYYDKEA